MTWHRELFTILVNFVNSKGKLGTNNIVSVQGKGVINIFTKCGERKYNPYVYFMFGLKHNFTSIVHLMEKGYRLYF